MAELYAEFERVLVEEEAIQQRVAELAEQISEDYRGQWMNSRVYILRFTEKQLLEAME